MGWLYSHISGTPKDELRGQFEGSTTHRLLDLAIVAKSEAYMAVENIATGTVQAWVFLVDLKTSKAGRWNFGYKDMHETMLPYFYRCPKRILDKLSPVEECYPGENRASSRESATQWRTYCWETLDGRRKTTAKRAAARKSLPDGAKVRFSSSLRFGDGKSRDTFTVKLIGRKLRFIGEDGVLCQIPGLATLEFSRID